MARRDFLKLSGGAIAAGAVAALSVVVALSARSAGRRATTVDVPDFTRGRWKTNPSLDIVHM